MDLARIFIERAESNIKYSLPAVFDLSHWKSANQTISRWLIQELHERYQIDKKISKAWIKDENLLILLNGFNGFHQFPANYQNACVLALNKFIREHGKTEIIVCSHARYYENLPPKSHKLNFQRAIYIKSAISQQ